MREIQASQITQAVRELSIASCYRLGQDVTDALSSALDREKSPIGKDILEQILENAEISREGVFPLCQDTGYTVVFVELGQEVRVIDGDLEGAIHEGVRKGYEEGYLRKSIVADPLRRQNTGDNTPAAIWVRIVPGDRIRLLLAPKGGGCENMSVARILKPSQGRDGVRDFVIKTVEEAGGNPCPPLIVGVGIGGTFEMSAWLAKRALFRRLGDRHPDPFYAELETELLTRINDTGIGPMGLGGRITALAVHVETAPCHIASLPVAVNFQCHSARHGEAVL